VLQAFRVAERVLLPVLVNLDAFYVSHALEPVQVPAQERVDAFLPPYAPEHRLDTAKVESWGNVVTPEMFYRHRQALGAAMDQVPAVALEADREWSALTGRSYGLVERYRCDGAGIVIVTMGSMCGTARDAVDTMRDDGLAVGLVKVRLFRPLPVQALVAALAGVPEVLVLDRNYSPGHGGVLHQELRAALYGMPGAPRIHGYLAGVGGVNVSPSRIAEFVRTARASEALPHSVWVE
jgi:pyruvate/2-oxoacid:ferredoxin oxidoreductase alpha subunit